MPQASLSANRRSTTLRICILLFCLSVYFAQSLIIKQTLVAAHPPSPPHVAQWEEVYRQQQLEIDEYHKQLGVPTCGASSSSSKPSSETTQTPPSSKSPSSTTTAATTTTTPATPTTTPSSSSKSSSSTPAAASAQSASSSATATKSKSKSKPSTTRPARPVLTASANGKPLVTLCMIVKDELNSLPSTLNSVLGFVDRYSILDTGSTDGSLEFIREWFEKHLEPDQYQLHQGPFVDFSTTRNEALRLAGNVSEFILFLNGDDRLVGGKAFRSFLENRRHMRGIDEEMYIVPINYGGISRGRSERISRSANHFVPNWPNDAFNHWKYEGVTHEVYINQHALQSGVQILYTPDELFHVFHDVTYDTNESKRNRFLLDVKLLKEEIETQPNSPNMARSVFYLAQSYYNLNMRSEAFEWFTRRVGINYPRPTDPKADNEKARSYGMMAMMAAQLGKTKKEMQGYLENAHASCPTSYSLMQLGRFHLDIVSDEKAAKKYAVQARDYLKRNKASMVCGDDQQSVVQELPKLLKRLGIK